MNVVWITVWALVSIPTTGHDIGVIGYYDQQSCNVLATKFNGKTPTNAECVRVQVPANQLYLSK